MPNGPEQEARDELFLSQLETGLSGDPFPSRWQVDLSKAVEFLS